MKNLVDIIEEFGNELIKDYPPSLVYKSFIWYALRNLKELEEVDTEVENCEVKVIWKNCPNPLMKRGRKRKKEEPCQMKSFSNTQ